MEKISRVIKEKSILEELNQIGNTLLVKSDNKCYLYNVLSKKFVSIGVSKRVICDKENNIFILFKDDGEMLVYDCIDEKYILNGYKAFMIYGDYDVILLLDELGKKHLFDKSIFRYDENAVKEAFDKIARIYNGGKNQYFKGKNDDDLSLYITGTGSFSFPEWSDIRFLCRVSDDVFFELENEYKKKGVYSINNGFLSNNLFDEVTLNSSNLIYLKNGDKISIFDITLNTWILKDIICEEIRLLGCNQKQENNISIYGEYRFVVNKSKIKELIGVDFNLQSLGKLKNRPTYNIKVTSLARNYNEIEYDENYDIAFLKKGDKKGVFIKNSHFTSLIEPRYDNVKYLGKGLYELNRDGKSVIARLQIILKFLIENCKIENHSNYGIIYEKENKYGILIPKEISNKGEDIIIPPIYDSIRHLGSEYYEVEKDFKKGIYKKDELIIPLEYKSINIHGDSEENNIEFSKHIYFSLQKENNLFDFVTLSNGELSYMTNEFRNIIFFPDFIMFKDDEMIYLYNYQMNLLKSLQANVKISVFKNKNMNVSSYLYCIDKDGYIFKTNKLVKVHTYEKEMFVSAYESEYGYVIVNSYDKNKFNQVCSVLDGISEEEFDKTIKQLNDKHLTLRPTK